VLQCMSCKIHRKSCYREREDTTVVAFCFFSGLNQFKPHVCQKLFFADINPSLKVCTKIFVYIVSDRKHFSVIQHGTFSRAFEQFWLSVHLNPACVLL